MSLQLILVNTKMVTGQALGESATIILVNTKMVTGQILGESAANPHLWEFY